MTDIPASTATLTRISSRSAVRTPTIPSTGERTVEPGPRARQILAAVSASRSKSSDSLVGK